MADNKGKEKGKEGEEGGDEGGDTPEYVTMDVLNTTLHKVVSAQLTRALKGFPTKGDFEQLVQSITKPKKKDDEEDDLEDGDDDGDDAPKGKAKRRPSQAPALDPAVGRQLKAQADALKKLNEELATERAGRAAEAEKVKRQEERTALATALKANKISDTLLEAAIALTLSEGRVKRDEDGAITFRSIGEYGAEEDVPLSEGVKRWAASDAAKAFKAPTGAQGGPGGRGNSTSSKGGKDKQPLTRDALGRALMNQMDIMRTGTPAPGGGQVLGTDPLGLLGHVERDE